MKLSSDEIKKELFDMLCVFDTFCKENNLTYYLVGGTLLGAVRHKGFIPWDDDIDLGMPRPDYEKMKSISDKLPAGYILDSYSHSQNAPFEKMLNTHLKVHTNTIKDVSYLWIDILPIDGLPADESKVKKIYKKEAFYQKIEKMHRAVIDKGSNAFTRELKHISKSFVRSVFGLEFCYKQMNKIAQKYKYEDCEYAGIVTWGLYGPGERFSKKESQNTVYVTFEGKQFPAFGCWDAYLKGIYGDYMKLPPVEKRANHAMDVWRED